MQLNIEVFWTVILSFWVSITRHAQSNQNKFAYLCNISIISQYLYNLVFSDWIYHFRCVWLGIPKLPKTTSLLFLYNMFRKKWVMQLIFYMQISMKACYRLILSFFDGYGQAFPKFPRKQVCNVFTISLKKLEMKLTFLMQINIKVS